MLPLEGREYLKKMEKKNYEKPRLTVVEFKMEEGYAGSGDRKGLGMCSGGDQELEGRTFGGNWGGNEW